MAGRARFGRPPLHAPGREKLARDVATSFNGIWKGCEDELRGARRVVRPGGLVGFTFWGSPKRLGLLPYFAALLELSPPGHVDATLNQGHPRSRASGQLR